MDSEVYKEMDKVKTSISWLLMVYMTQGAGQLVSQYTMGPQREDLKLCS